MAVDLCRDPNRLPPRWLATRSGGIIEACTTTAEPLPLLSVGEWNELRITLSGELVSVALNGVETTRFDPGAPVPPRQRDSEPERGPRRPETRRTPVMDDRQRSSLEIPDDEIDIPEFLK